MVSRRFLDRAGNVRSALLAIAVCCALALAGCAGSSVASPSQGEPASGVGAGAGHATLDLADAGDRALVNELLGAVVETRRSEPFDSASLGTLDMVGLAATHVAIHEPQRLEEGDFTAVAGPGGGVRGTSNVRVGSDRVAEACRETFGRVPDYAAIAAPNDERYAYADGYVYFGHTVPEGQSVHYAVATGLEGLGDGLYRVSFDVYSSGNMPFGSAVDPRTGGRVEFDVSVGGFYGMTAEEARGLLGDPERVCAGEATVKAAYASSGGAETGGASAGGAEKDVVLVSYATSPAGKSAGSAGGGAAAGYAGGDIVTPYYTIAMPAGWPDGLDVSCEYDEKVSWSGEYGWGYATTVHIGSGAISVACCTDNWGPQGDVAVKDLGPASLDGWHVVAFTARHHPGERDDRTDLTGYLDEFCSFVQLRGSERDQASDPGPAVSEPAVPEAADSASRAVGMYMAEGGNLSYFYDYELDVTGADSGGIYFDLAYNNTSLGQPYAVRGLYAPLEGNVASFSYDDDGWGNSGTGVLEFADDYSSVLVRGTQTKAPGHNPAALVSESGATLVRRR